MGFFCPVPYVSSLLPCYSYDAVASYAAATFMTIAMWGLALEGGTLLTLREIAMCNVQSYERVGSGGSGRGNPDAASTASGVAPVGGSRVRGRGNPEAARDSGFPTVLVHRRSLVYLRVRLMFWFESFSHPSSHRGVRICGVRSKGHADDVTCKPDVHDI